MKNWISYIARLILSLLILWLLFALVDIGEFSRAMRDLQPGWFLLAFVLNVIGSILIPAVITWRSLPAGKIRLSFWYLTRVNFAVRLYTLIFPRGVATGIRWFRYRSGGGGHDAFALVVFEKVVQILILMLTATVFLTLDLDKLPGAGRAILGVAVVGLLISATGLMMFVSPAVARGVVRLTRGFPRFTPRPIRRRSERLWEAVVAFQSHSTGRIAEIVALSLLSYLFFILCPYALCFAMKIDLSLQAIAWIRSLTLMLALIPITVAGLGVRDVSYVAFMRLYDIDQSTALAFSIALFLIQIMIGLIGAALETPKLLAPGAADRSSIPGVTDKRPRPNNVSIEKGDAP